MIKEIYSRRSIRKYSSREIGKEMIEAVLEAGMAAPSAKNRQPWEFIVTDGKEKERMLSFMRQGIEREEAGQGILSQSRQYVASAKHTLEIMRQSPVVIFILDRQGRSLHEPMTAEEKVYDRANLQSIGAAIQNMSLEATNLGLGSLWICDIFFAYDDLNRWLGAKGEMAAALALGYADENPPARPRKALAETVEWRTDK